MDELKTKENIMFKKLWNGIGRHKYTLSSILVISIFTSFSFFWSLATGEYLKISENKNVSLVLFLFRCVIYITLFVLVEKRLKGNVKMFLSRLLAFTVLFYELVVVFNIPTLLLEQYGA